jgi:hypothetical protein
MGRAPFGRTALATICRRPHYLWRMTIKDETPRPRPPRSEPEIIPPGAPHGSDPESVVFVEMRGGRILPLFRPSLVTLLLIAGVVGLMLAVLLVLLLGAFLISLPVVALLFVGLLIASLLRAHGRLRR